MEDWRQFLWTVAASSAGTTTLLAAAAWLFKGQISHWLNKDLEAAKAQHQRELEAYKISLIAAAERAKAGQEIKRASALKMMEIKFDALRRLFETRRTLGSEFLGHAAMPVTWKTAERHSLASARLDSFTEAMGGIELFVASPDYGTLVSYRGELVKVLNLCQPGVAPMSEDDHRSLSHALYAHEIAADRMIQAQVLKLESLD
jgi:hypothetical protein